MNVKLGDCVIVKNGDAFDTLRVNFIIMDYNQVVWVCGYNLVPAASIEKRSQRFITTKHSRLFPNQKVLISNSNGWLPLKAVIAICGCLYLKDFQSMQKHYGTTNSKLEVFGDKQVYPVIYSIQWAHNSGQNRDLVKRASGTNVDFIIEPDYFICKKSFSISI